uniref:Mutant desert hedgehog n=1 Tax=Homo sapiens TaxID=9606 RepID=F6KSZ5_HUMAN|nr:mutant desert hedgehog [Homo sapiens]
MALLTNLLPLCCLALLALPASPELRAGPGAGWPAPLCAQAARAATLQAICARRARADPGRQWASGGEGGKGLRALPGPRAQLQPRHHLQG